MSNLSYPGVYVEELPAGARPIELAGTSTAAFVGVTEMGPTEKAVRISSWEEYRTKFGGFIEDGYMAESVYQFFNNGGNQCYVVRIVRRGDNGAKIASATVNNRAGQSIKGVKFSAKNVGAWGNSIYLNIEESTSDPDNEFKLIVRRQSDAAVVPDDFNSLQPLEVYDDLSINADDENYISTVLSRHSNYIESVVVAENTNLQRGSLKSGMNPVLPVSENTISERRFLINIDNDGFQEVTLATSVDNTPEAIADAMTKEIAKLKKKKSSTHTKAFAKFECEVEKKNRDAWLILKSGSNTEQGTENSGSSVVVMDAPQQNGAGYLKLNASSRTSAESATALRRPVLVEALQLGDASITGDVADASLGSDGTSELTVAHYISQFSWLNDKSDFSILAVPGVGTKEIFNAGMAFCENRPLRDVFYLGETNREVVDVSEAETFRKGLAKANSYAALYYPWVKADDPSGRSSSQLYLPPSGFVAGIYARIDSSRGVWKAPAGTEASLNGATGVLSDITDTQQGNLNRINVNAIRRFDSAGIVTWGARTISADQEYRYVPVRRTSMMLRKSIYNGIQWAIFEPNDNRLWSSLRLNIDSFMNGLFRSGAFQGAQSSNAYFVRCGLGETMTQGDVDRGQVIVLIGFAPVKPAEFVVVRIQQTVGQL